MRLFENSNEFIINQDISIKKQGNRMKLFFQGKEFNSSNNKSTAYLIIDEIFQTGFFDNFETRDIKSFLKQTKTKYIFADYLISCIDFSKLSCISSHQFFNILDKLSKFYGYYEITIFFREIIDLLPHLNTILEPSRSNIQLALAHLTADSLSRIHVLDDNNPVIKFLKKNSKYLTHFLLEMLIEEFDQMIYIHPGVVQALEIVGGQAKVKLKTSLRWAMSNIEYFESYSDSENFQYLISVLLKHLPSKEILLFLDKQKYKRLEEITFDPHNLFTNYLVNHLVKGLRYPDKQVRRISESLISKLGSRLLVSITWSLKDFKGNLDSTTIKVFSKIVNLPQEFLQNIVFKVLTDERDIVNLFYKHDYYSSYDPNPELEDIGKIFSKCYSLISNKIDSDFQGFNFNLKLDEQQYSKLLGDIFSVINYLLGRIGISIKEIENKEELKKKILAVFNKLKSELY